uniref:IQ motif containing GTPase activating protein homolog n=1 Tax=Phallusia mammillata TaxID=59560 RepID=A0A6F9DEL5_9ASCI|nr:IQ motif containing GTPase activating protein homolog [Phallusia mammillata]
MSDVFVVVLPRPVTVTLELSVVQQLAVLKMHSRKYSTGSAGSTNSLHRRQSLRAIDYGITKDDRLSAEEMDNLRDQATAYEYLCHLEEAKQWMEYCLQEDLPPSIELEEGLRNGVYLGKLAHYFAPDTIPLRKVYDKDMKKYNQKGLHFKHTDNINHLFKAMEKVGLPKIFYPETTDIYDRKNMPKTIYCIHALSLYLFKLGLAPQMKDLYGIAEFTEEELNNMQKELGKYGLQMPQFHKIGGILANELSVDEAALHAAVIAINEALEAGDEDVTMAAMRNPNACLNHLDATNKSDYQQRLLASKLAKADAAKNKTKDKPEDDRDMYEELLTHAEIQGNLTKINLDIKLQKINDELTQEGEGLIDKLKDLGITNLDPNNLSWYLEEMRKALEAKREATGDPSCKLDKDEIQAAINAANLRALKQKQREEAVQNINTLLVESGSPEDLMNELLRPEADFPSILNRFPQLYHQELTELKESKGEDLTHEEISGFLPHLSALAALNQELAAGDTESIWKAMQEPELGLERLEKGNRSRCCEELKKQKQEKSYLGYEDVQTTVDDVNSTVQEEHARIKAVNDVNDALASNDRDAILLALQNPALQLTNVEPENITHYLRLMKKKKQEKMEETGDPDAALWIEEIQSCIDQGNHQTRQALKQASAVTAVNIAIEDEDWEQTYGLLRHTDIALASLTMECAQTYHEQLKEVRTENLDEGLKDTTWVAYKTREGDTYYFNTEELGGSWDKPEDFQPETAQLTKEEIQECISMVSAAYDRAQLWRDNEPLIIKLQAFCRMYIARKAYKERKNFIANQLPAITLIQAQWRGYRQWKAYNERLKYFRDHVDAIIVMQKWLRMHQARSKYTKRLNYFKDHVKTIIRLQAWFRSNKARHDYKTLIGVENPPLPVVQRFVHLLDQRATDFAEEIELQDLKQRVVQCIKSNNELEEALNTMDIKIGLLVKNRITLQDVINHSKNLRKKQGKESAVNEQNAGGAAGLKSLNKSNRARLEAYQHLFYLLQTNPTYFGKLIFKMAAGRTTNFMQSVILTVYNYASNQREEYLLLKLFKTALQEEIESKVDKVKEIATGNPLVIKMVVTFNRGAKGQSSLRQILAPQVQEVMKNKTLSINMSPVEIYKAWISQKETETGEASDLPYEVSTAEAMKHDEVKKRVEDSITQLRTVTDSFMTAILNSIDAIPYGLRYIAKCLKNLLKQKFPDTPEDEVLKMVGNLIYYRYMNPAIVAPDAFDIIDVSAGASGLNNDQRRNLGSIAKVLQFASTGKTFAGDMQHLRSINNYLMEAYQRFKNFFVAVCEVPDPEEKYNMDEYSDAVLLVKPVIFITIKEILDTHKLLLEHADEIAPDTTDPLHDTLEELGEVPDLAALVGTTMAKSPKRGEQEGGKGDGDQMDHIVKTEVSLTLASRVEVKEDDDSDIKNLLLRTKRMVIDIIRVQVGENLTDVLDTEATDQQEEEHMRNVEKLEERKKQEQADDKDKDESMLRTRSLLNENKLPLEDMKRRVKRNLEKLESHGIVSKDDHYQAIVNLIARDIRNQRRYRQRRKQELTKLKQNMDRLDQKAKFFEEQSDYYNQYIKSCLASLANKSKKNQKKKRKVQAVKYTASELHRKKVLLEIEGLETSQFRNVMFEIAQTEEDVGRFDVSAKFLGVNMEKVNLVFQDLLQLQYEGVSVMKMFDGRARINVNLLIFLLNKKFFGK